MKSPTLAEKVIEFLKSLHHQLLFQLQRLERILGGYAAYHNPIMRDRDGLYHSWNFPDGSRLRADILENGWLAVDA